eukprot:gnl/TRDRNA2_/TRDRNA2_171353_c0_seq4.p1 gnl/TRDRNA2_/TRDRNA2_171353_c0~~gnl/TRDRNA2_/TRDRNA2_171353_c0_seq4.p1  ORF type:complete len:145 (-),score=10.33 gnl/TRDRNA2_/TRDRNA2_171353_c0_seq4:164-598(-)
MLTQPTKLALLTPASRSSAVEIMYDPLLMCSHLRDLISDQFVIFCGCCLVFQLRGLRISDRQSAAKCRHSALHTQVSLQSSGDLLHAFSLDVVAAEVECCHRAVLHQSRGKTLCTLVFDAVVTKPWGAVRLTMPFCSRRCDVSA